METSSSKGIRSEGDQRSAALAFVEKKTKRIVMYRSGLLTGRGVERKSRSSPKDVPDRVDMS
jgi:hypothetical protein